MLQTSAEGIQDKIWLGGEGDPLGIVQVIEIWPSEQMVSAQIRKKKKENKLIN